MNYMDDYETLRKQEGSIDCSLSSDKTELLKKICETCTNIEIFNSINKYPAQIYEEFKRYLSQKFGGKKFFLGSGSEDIIWKINSLLLKGKKTGVVIPNFYRIYETLVDPVYVKVSTEINNSIISIASIEQALIKKKLEALWISNPNPITGQCFKMQEIKKLITDFPNVLFVVDEVSMDTVYDEHSFSLLLQNQDFLNLIIIRSMSKFYGIPGARLGYASMNEEFLTYMLCNTAVFPVSGFTILIAKKLMNDNSFQAMIKSQICNHRLKIQRLIECSRYLSFLASETNVLVIKCKKMKIDFWKILTEKNVITFSIGTEKGVEDKNIVRFTIPSDEIRFKKLYDILKEIIESYQL